MQTVIRLGMLLDPHTGLIMFEAYFDVIPIPALKGGMLEKASCVAKPLPFHDNRLTTQNWAKGCLKHN